LWFSLFYFFGLALPCVVDQIVGLAL